MYKLPIKLLLVLILGTYIFLICLVPLKLYKLGLIDIFGQIFPALDVVIIYYFSTYTNVLDQHAPRFVNTTFSIPF